MRAIVKEGQLSNVGKIAGWLVLPALGLVFAIGREGLDTWLYLKTFVLSPSLDIFLELAFEMPWLMFVLIVAAFFFRKHRWTPYLYIVLLCGYVGFAGLYVLLHMVAPAEEITDTPRELTRAVLQATIWIPYFMRSRRVKRTFVNAW